MRLRVSVFWSRTFFFYLLSNNSNMAHFHFDESNRSASLLWHVGAQPVQPTRAPNGFPKAQVPNVPGFDLGFGEASVEYWNSAQARVSRVNPRADLRAKKDPTKRSHKPARGSKNPTPPQIRDPPQGSIDNPLPAYAFPPSVTLPHAPRLVAAANAAVPAYATPLPLPTPTNLLRQHTAQTVQPPPPPPRPAHNTRQQMPQQQQLRQTQPRRTRTRPDRNNAQKTTLSFPPPHSSHADCSQPPPPPEVPLPQHTLTQTQMAPANPKPSAALALLRPPYILPVETAKQVANPPVTPPPAPTVTETIAQETPSALQDWPLEDSRTAAFDLSESLSSLDSLESFIFSSFMTIPCAGPDGEGDEDAMSNPSFDSMAGMVDYPGPSITPEYHSEDSSLAMEDFLEASPVWCPCDGIDDSGDEWAQLTQLSLLANRMPAEQKLMS